VRAAPRSFRRTPSRFTCLLTAQPILPSRAARSARWPAWLAKGLLWAGGTVVALALCAGLAGLMALAIAYPNLPDVSGLSNYHPKLPLRVYTAEGQLIGEFGEERRTLTPIGQIPKVMKDAVLAIEDARFYEHNGIDYLGVLRAALANLGRRRARARPPSPCRWRATSTCRRRRPTRARSTRCCSLKLSTS
jgi:penicillin-binding protein 1A